MTDATHAAILSCSECARQLAYALRLLAEVGKNENTLPREQTSPPLVQYEKEDLAWLDDVLPTTHADPLAHVDETLLLGDTALACDETLSDVVADPGTQAAISTVRTKDLDLVRPVLPVLPVLAVQSGDMGEPEGEKNPAHLPDNFCLTKAPAVKPELKFFDARLFAEFWEAYPRRVGKKDAIKAFTAIDPNRGEVEMMIAAIEAQRGSREWIEGFIPHPATWLRAERWADEIEPAPLTLVVTRAVGPRAEGGTWRDRCTHTPACETPSGCELRRQREGIA